MARSSAPARRFRHAALEKGEGRREKRGVRGHYAVGYRQGKESREKGGGKRGECVDGALERARAAIRPRVP